MAISEQQSKGSRGGRRPGAGRKPSTLKGIAKMLPRECSELILAEINANQKWKALCNSKKESIALEALKYLTDRAYGKAKQSRDVSISEAERMDQALAEARARVNSGQRR
jgi:hypothetical protein